MISQSHSYKKGNCHMNKWFPSRMTRWSKREYRAALGAALLAVTVVFGAFSFAPSAHAASLIPASSSGVQQAEQVSLAAADYPDLLWIFPSPDAHLTTNGHIIFYNRSVQIGGQLSVLPGVLDCGAVTFLVYAGTTRLNSATRPGTGQYYCGVGNHTFGFTLPADVAGGADHVVVQIWEDNPPRMVAQRSVIGRIS
jgi:hypothetical protein